MFIQIIFKKCTILNVLTLQIYLDIFNQYSSTDSSQGNVNKILLSNLVFNDLIKSNITDITWRSLDTPRAKCSQ